MHLQRSCGLLSCEDCQTYPVFVDCLGDALECEDVSAGIVFACLSTVGVFMMVYGKLIRRGCSGRRYGGNFCEDASGKFHGWAERAVKNFETYEVLRMFVMALGTAEEPVGCELHEPHRRVDVTNGYKWILPMQSRVALEAST